MKWFWRYVWRKMKQIGNEPESIREQDVPIMAGTISSRGNSFDGDSGLNIRIHRAIGGRIVSFSHYDRKTDRENKSVYIITDEQDFERELGRIITLESMRG